MSFLKDIQKFNKSDKLSKVKTKVTNQTGQVHYEEMNNNNGRFLEIVSHKPPNEEKSANAPFFIVDTAPDEQLHQVIKGLYIGSQDAAYNKEELTKLNVNCIVNAAQGIPNGYPNEIEYLNVPLLDLDDNSDGANALKYFDSTALWIQKRINDSKNILVHCNAGVSRSSTLVIAYLIKYENYTLESALEKVKGCRPQCQPNRGFMSQLKQYQMSINK